MVFILFFPYYAIFFLSVIPNPHSIMVTTILFRKDYIITIIIIIIIKQKKLYLSQPSFVMCIDTHSNEDCTYPQIAFHISKCDD